MIDATIVSPLDTDPPPDCSPRPPSRYQMPEAAVDTHAHVIGSDYISQRSYTPCPAPPSDYLRMMDATAVTYGVLIQVSVHGTDNTLLLNTLRSQPARLRGVAVAPHTLPEAEWRAMKEAGVVGLRLNTTTGGGVGVDHIDEYEAICRELGWHLQFLVHAEQLPSLANRIGRLRVPTVFDHMAYVNPEQAQQLPGATLRDLVRDGAWVKLSGGFRLSKEGAPYQDTIPLARALVEAAPTRCVWGSDWPHVAFRGPMPNTGDLLDLLADWVPEPGLRTNVLVHNPHALYGFAPGA